MNVQLQSTIAPAFEISVAVCVVAIAACFALFVSPFAVVPLILALLFWAVFRYPVSALGVVLAFMPIDYIAIELGKFYGLPYMTLVSVFDKEILLLLLTLVLWRRNGFKPTAPDWFLLACFVLAAVHTVFEGSWPALALDFSFIISYFVGRMTVLAPKQEQLWAKCAVWIVGILSVLGLSEIFIFGEGPRTLLYLSTDAETEGGKLTASFHAIGFEGLREAATMVGPNGFGALCMIALILWWVYSRNPLPAVMITMGLVCSLTRAAWLGTAVAIPVLAFLMDQKKRFFLYGALALVLFVTSIPVLGLSDFVLLNKTGQDPSAEGHRNEIVSGLEYVSEHPFGSGNGKVSPWALNQDSNATTFETTYVSMAAEYGIAASLCFIAFLFSTLRLVWRERSQLSHAAIGISVAMSMVMIFTIPLFDRRLACWAMFPVGLAVQSCTRGDKDGIGNSI